MDGQPQSLGHATHCKREGGAPVQVCGFKYKFGRFTALVRFDSGLRTSYDHTLIVCTHYDTQTGLPICGPSVEAPQTA